MKRCWSLLLFGLLACHAWAAEVIPPAPTAYFNDYAHVVSPATASELNQTLENFERQSSDQILVAIYPKMQSDSSVADYTVRVARAWKVGQRHKNNGAVLFVFVQNHKMFLQVGYGLEGVLPDALCEDIIADKIAPRFKAGDYDGGLTAGVQAILAAVKGEYHGTGRTVAEQREQQHQWASALGGGLIFLIFLFFLIARARAYSGLGAGWLLTSGGFGGWGGGGGFGGGFGGGGFGGGGFSGGGGSFGGGGAGGGW